MRIVTWNVNSLKARLGYLLDFLETRQPDIVCIQELKLADPNVQALAPAIKAAGYNIVAHGQPSWNGVAILSKATPKLLQIGLPGAEANGARLITAEIGGQSITSVYVPNGKSVQHPDFQAKLRWLDLFGNYVDALMADDKPVIIGGDFNLCPADIDSYDPEHFAGANLHTAEERQNYDRWSQAGLVDMFRKLDPDTPGFSFWDYRWGQFHRGKGLRIDLLLMEPQAANCAIGTCVDRDFRKKRDDRTPSDHAPVIVDLD